MSLGWVGPAPPPIRAQVPPDTVRDTLPSAPLDTIPAEDSPQAAAIENEPCSLAELDPDDQADILRSKVYRTACGSALWFDALFRDDRLLNETVTTRGWVQFGGSYREVQKFEPRVRGQVRVVLPAAERRFNAFFGRDDPDALLSDTDDRTRHEERVQDGDRADEWLLGLGYTPFNNRLNNLSFGAGVTMKWPLDPYVRGQYRYHWEVTEKFLVRAQQTLFWKYSESVGATSRVDLERPLGTRFLLRWDGRGTVSRYRWGLDWYSGFVLFQNLGGPQAMAYRVFAEGLTGLPYNVRDYGVTVTYRKGTARPWLWVELLAGLYWPRLSPLEERRTNPGAGLMLEVRFP